MATQVASALKELERRKADYGDGAGRRKLDLLRLLSRRRLSRAKDVLRLHEVLCFLRAYPDSAEVLAEVEHMLHRFEKRGDLRRHSDALASTGIAGTSFHFAFFAATANWLARRWSAYVTIDWEDFDRSERLERILPLLALYSETPGLDEYSFELHDWIERMKGPAETDAVFLLRRLEQLPMSSFAHEMLFEDLDIPLHLRPGPDTPARTREKYADVGVVHQSRALSRARPSLPSMMNQDPPRVRLLSRREGQTLVNLARATMATRSRDLDAFAYGEANDVRLVGCGNGLQLAYIGVLPERRLLLETLYGFLALKNGVPVGYGTNTVLFGSAEVAFTIFDTFRAAEAALVFAQVLAITKHLFGADTFLIEPYQLGQDNDDAVRSGAWWFYQKMGFRPRETSARRIMQRELKRMKTNPSHRSSESTLKKLAAADVFLTLGKRRNDVLGVLPLANLGLCITRYVAERFGFDRAKATRTCSAEALKLLDLRSLGGFSAGERLAWQRWAPLLMILPGVKRWRGHDKRALVKVVRAKGGQRESDYVHQFDRHQRLRHAICSLAERE